MLPDLPIQSQATPDLQSNDVLHGYTAFNAMHLFLFTAGRPLHVHAPLATQYIVSLMLTGASIWAVSWTPATEHVSSDNKFIHMSVVCLVIFHSFLLSL